MAAFYKPYLSDDESDSDGYTSEESLLNLPGKLPPVQTGMSARYGDDTPITAKGPKFEVKESRNTTLFTVNSRDRDAQVYPQPTYFSIRLPRAFKNVATVNISQLNLLNSFFNFTFNGGNTYMSVYEVGRVNNSGNSNITTVKIRDGSYVVDDLVNELTSALNATPLFADITLGNFINGFQATGDFTILFNTPGTVVFNSLTQTYDSNQTIQNIVARYFQTVQTVGTLNFNYFQCLVAYYYPVMKELIISTNPKVPFQSSSAPPDYTWYDYLVFAFTGLDDPYVTGLLTDPSYGAANQAIFDTYRYDNTFNSYLVNQYNCTYNSKQGRLVITAPNLNPSIQNDLTTQYNFYLNSLVIQNGFNSVADFQSQYTAISYSNSIALELYNFIQSRFTSNFAVNFGQYTASFYSDSNNNINIYSPLNRFGWNTTLSPAISESPTFSNSIPAQVSSFWKNIVLSKNFVSQDEFISTLTVSEFTGGQLAFSNAGESQLGYTDIVYTQRPTTYNRIAFSTRCRQNISIMTLPRYIDNREASTNMVYHLGSTLTQTPLLYDVRNPNTTFILTDISGNLTFNMFSVNQNMFSTPDYMRTFDEWSNPQNLTPQILAGRRLQITDVNYNKQASPSDLFLTSYRPYIFFQINAAEYPVEVNARFNIRIYIETQDDSTLGVPLTVTWYKDRAGFMADAQNVVAGNYSADDPRHYFLSDTTNFTATTVSSSIRVTVNNNQQTYLSIHVQNPNNLPSSVPIRIFALLDDEYGDFTYATVEDRYDLPFSSILSSLVSQKNIPFSPKFQNPTKSIYSTSIFQLGYDISGVSNNLLDYIIQSQNSYNYDPNNIGDYLNGSSTGLQYYFVETTNGATQPPPTLSNTWSLYFGPTSANAIYDSYNLSGTYLSASKTPKPLKPGMNNEFLLVNWFKAGGSAVERFLYPNIDANYYTQISTGSIFIPCINGSNLPTDMVPPNFLDISGFCGMSFFLPPNQVVKLDSFLIKFAYTQPITDPDNINYTRENSPLVSSNNVFYNLCSYQNRTTYIQASEPASNWDDWFFRNRRNTKLGVFPTASVNGANISTLQLSNALCTFTLEKITQVNSYKNQSGTLLTREPEWGTYYTYSISDQTELWDVSGVSFDDPTQFYWYSTLVAPADFAPTYTAGNMSYSSFFLTPAQIYNYTYLPRTYGIAPSVGNANYTVLPYASTYTADIPNSFTMVPFYNDPATGNWLVGSFYGVSYTDEPVLPSTGIAGAAPYSGPAGGYGWMVQPDSTIQLAQVSSVSCFYWNTKVQYETLDLQYDPATDLSAFGGYTGIQSEYQDTMLFVYKNTTAGLDYNDVSKTVQTKQYWLWGQESNANYAAYDDSDGYNLLSYVYGEPLSVTIPEYAIHVRAYDPIPQFTTGVRFIGKNYTDFGSPTLGEIATEISSLAGYTPISDVQAGGFIQNLYSTMTNGLPLYGPYTSTISTNDGIRLGNGNYFSHEYADALVKFDETFKTSTLFGLKVGYTGVLFNFANYSDCLNQYISLYSTTQASLKIYTTILSTATGDLSAYTTSRYGNILPSSVLTRSRITDPLTFQLLLSTPLVEPHKSQYDQWGLGWNLGFNKRDTPPSVSVTSDTFIRIVQDYIYLQLNPEFNINSVAVSGKEDRSMCLDSAGQESKYFSKIILNDFANYCRTAVQQAKQFNPVLGKYETLTCQLVDKNGNNISSIDCEYDFVLEVTEITTGPADTASLLTTTADLDVYSGNKIPIPR